MITFVALSYLCLTVCWMALAQRHCNIRSRNFGVGFLMLALGLVFRSLSTEGIFRLLDLVALGAAGIFFYMSAVRRPLEKTSIVLLTSAILVSSVIGAFFTDNIRSVLMPMTFCVCLCLVGSGIKRGDTFISMALYLNAGVIFMTPWFYASDILAELKIISAMILMVAVVSLYVRHEKRPEKREEKNVEIRER